MSDTVLVGALVFKTRSIYLFLLRPRPASPSAGSGDFQGGRAARTAAASLEAPGMQTGSSTWTPAVKAERRNV